MDWKDFAQTWGPAVPMFGIFVWYLHQLIFRVNAKGFRDVNRTILEQTKRAERRHAETMKALAGVIEACRACRCNRQPPIKNKSRHRRAK